MDNNSDSINEENNLQYDDENLNDNSVDEEENENEIETSNQDLDQNSNSRIPTRSRIPFRQGSSPRSEQKIKPLHERSLNGFSIYINKNAYPRDLKPKLYRFKTFDKLLSESMNVLNLNSKATKIFTDKGVLVNGNDDIKEGQTYYVSCGEKFNYGMPSPVKKRPLSQIDRSPQQSKVEEKEQEEKEPPPPTKTKEQIALEKKRQFFLKEQNSFNRTMVMAQRTLEEALRVATSSVFEQLGENQRIRLPNWYSVQTIHDDTQFSLFQRSLINQKICPSSNEVLPELDSWVLDSLKNISLNELKLVLAGPRQSGKTTLLYSLATLLLRKLQVSDSANSYLLFPLNFEFQTLELNDHNQLLRLFIKIAFDSLEYSCLPLVPYLQQLRKWFIMTVYGSPIQFPTPITGIHSADSTPEQIYPRVNAASIKSLAKSIGDAIKGTGRDGLEKFLQAVVELPYNLAKAVGLNGVIYILDSFEYSDYYYTPCENCFPESLKPISLSRFICNELNKKDVFYLVSFQEEEHFMECFSSNDAALIDTVGLLRDVTYSAEIIVRKPPLRIGFEDCLGCPGYINKFDKLCNLVRAMNINSSTTSQYAPMKTSSDMSRAKVVKQEMIRFCQLLHKGGSEIVTEDVLNSMFEEELLVVTVNENEPEAEAEEDIDENKKSEEPQPDINE